LAPPPAPVPEPAPAEGRLLAPAPAAPLNNVRLAPTPALAAPGPLLPRLEGPLATVAQPAPARELVSPVLQGPRVVPVPALPTPAASERAVLPPAMAPLPSPTATPDLPPPVAPPAAAPSTTPSTTPSPAVAAPNLPDATSPADAGSRIGHDVATPGSAAASAPKKLNLELARPRGGELSRMGSVGALPVLPRLPDNDKLARDIEKAGRADCAKAYREAGLMAAVPLVVDALKKDGGCKW
jgi:hypothetical protein